MFDIQNELINLNYREVVISPKDLFPKLNFDRIKARFMHLKKSDVHQTIYGIVKSLNDGGYALLIEEQGFYDSNYQSFSWHSHQCCAILSLVLHALGFEVFYLEGFRIRDYIGRTGIIDQISPHEEENPDNRKEFERIRRIPYSCVEVIIKEKPYFISPKHVRLNLENGSLQALLMPECYIDFMGCFRHQNDALKSGIYIKQIIPENNLHKHNFNKRIVWTKRTFKDERTEYFATYLRMKFE